MGVELPIGGLPLDVTGIASGVRGIAYLIWWFVLLMMACIGPHSFGILAIYGAILVVTLSVVHRTTISSSFQMSSTVVRSICALVLIALVLWVSIGYQRTGDRDEALQLATSRLIHGEFPYSARTSLGNAVTPFPGALLLAIPFVIIGNVGLGLQSIVCLASLSVYLQKFIRRSTSQGILFFTLICCPVVLTQLRSHGDLVSNAIYVMMAFSFMLECAMTSPDKWRRMSLVAVLCGVSLSSRLNVFLMMPTLFFGLRFFLGLKSAIKYIALVIGAFLLVSLPFFLYDPAGFSPLHLVSERLQETAGWKPFGVLTIPFVVGVIAVSLGLIRKRWTMQSFWMDLGIVQFLLFTASYVSGYLHNSNYYLDGYGIFYIFTGCAACSLGLEMEVLHEKVSFQYLNVNR